MTKVKICGLSTSDTMQAALNNGADLVGLVFFPKSPRNVSIAQATQLANLAAGQAQTVALIVDASDNLITDILKAIKPDYFQAHGHETPERIAEIKTLTGRKIIKAIAVESLADIAKSEAYKKVADLILFDAKAPQSLVGALPGGNGISFDWTLMKGVARPYMLSGGLNPDNVAAAITLTQAPLVDVSSGVETAPGIKDVELIAKFIKAAKSA